LPQNLALNTYSAGGTIGTARGVLPSSDFSSKFVSQKEMMQLKTNMSGSDASFVV
jgi:hypothetical protein